MTQDTMTVGDAVARLTEFAAYMDGEEDVTPPVWHLTGRAIRVVLDALTEREQDSARLESTSRSLAFWKEQFAAAPEGADVGSMAIQLLNAMCRDAARSPLPSAGR